ncbi:germin-like protein 11-1 [Elaeis guineensis]|uniref:Germin-like protein n=1 Tax=Elaeis guineensis var. tenera TaxID=51953 RepID=A0A6I9RNZ1_ELAGV|nr:germin-like protein 11-1 [Elaeis guineensis]
MELSALLFSSLLLLLLSGSFPTGLADSSPLRDTCPMDPRGQRKLFMNGFLCKDPETITPSDFKTSMLEKAGDTDNFVRSSMNVVTATEFPGLNTLGLSVARTDLAMDGMVLPHSHPRASEMMYVVQGTVIAGFIDTKDRPFQKILKEGDVFVIPRGLLHFCVNAGFGPATIHSVLNSQNPGVVSIAGAMFLSDSHLPEKLVARMVSLRAMELGRNRTDTAFHES